MCSYSAVGFTGSGKAPVPSCANVQLLKTELREQLGFDEQIVGDCSALANEVNGQKWAATNEDAVSSQATCLCLGRTG